MNHTAHETKTEIDPHLHPIHIASNILIDEFGNIYREYMAKTPPFIPLFGTPSSPGNLP